MSVDRSSHVVAIVGGSSAGSVSAGILAASGVHVVVFEQHARPYGKVEDGLPRWHVRLRAQEYQKIDERLSRNGVMFVPRTRLGRDLDFTELLTWGWSAVLLANGAWRDRPLDLEGAEAFVGQGLLYQNPFVRWFNHAPERDYDGPRYVVPDGVVCVGGGLASIDVVKICQLERYAAALNARGAETDVVELERLGIAKACQLHGIRDPAACGVRDAVLLYRRRIEDMPLTQVPASADEAQRRRADTVRRRIVGKAQEKYRFVVKPLASPVQIVAEHGQVVGVRVVANRLERGVPRPIPGSERVLDTSLVISAIGSVPEPLPGIAMRGALYDFRNLETGAYGPVPGVFGVGNAVTGRGNIAASVHHGMQVAHHLLEAYLGIGEPGERDVSRGLLAGAETIGERAADVVRAHLGKVAPLPADAVRALLARARDRQAAVGYAGDYRAWMRAVSPDAGTA